MEISSELLVAVAAAILSLLFSYIPGLRTWYAALGDEVKRLIMLGLLIVVTGAVYAMDCYAIIDTNITCDKKGIFTLVGLLVLAVTANQSTYLLTPQAADVRDIKLAEKISDAMDIREVIDA